MPAVAELFEYPKQRRSKLVRIRTRPVGQDRGSSKTVVFLTLHTLRFASQFGSTVDLSLSFSDKMPSVVRPPTPAIQVTMYPNPSSASSSVVDLSKPVPVFDEQKFEAQATPDPHPLPRPLPGKHRKYLMLFLFCFAEFMDSFIGSALYPAIRVIEEDLHVGPAEITWAFAAYSSTFSAFLLISGRLSDVYSASK